LRSETLEHLLARDPERVIRLAVKGMLPKGPLGRQMITKLRVYSGPTHPHAAQQPQPLALTSTTKRGGDVRRGRTSPQEAPLAASTNRDR
jgi:ribosomal protein L13